MGGRGDELSEPAGTRRSRSRSGAGSGNRENEPERASESEARSTQRTTSVRRRHRRCPAQPGVRLAGDGSTAATGASALRAASPTSAVAGPVTQLEDGLDCGDVNGSRTEASSTSQRSARLGGAAHELSAELAALLAVHSAAAGVEHRVGNGQHCGRPGIQGPYCRRSRHQRTPATADCWPRRMDAGHVAWCGCCLAAGLVRTCLGRRRGCGTMPGSGAPVVDAWTDGFADASRGALRGAGCATLPRGAAEVADFVWQDTTRMSADS
jgi:hypothetical protein